MAMVERGGARFGIEKVNYFSYMHWAACMESYLRKRDLWEIVAGGEAVEPTKGGLRWRRKAQMVLDALRSSVQRELADYIQNVKSPKAAWDSFAALFLNDSPAEGYKKMGHGLLNLNEPPMEGGKLCFVMLEKDCKTICHTRCLDPLPEAFMSSHRKNIWAIHEIKPATQYSLSGLPKCFLHPAFKNSTERKEWGYFMVFLQKNNRVAAVVTRACNFYILPPDKGTDYSYLEVQYLIKVAFSELNDQVPSCPGNMVCKDSLQKSIKDGLVHPRTQGSGSGLNSKKMDLAGVDGGPASHVFHQVTHGLGEESGDSSVIKVGISNSLHRESNTPVEQHSRDGNMACKDSLQKSIKDGLVHPRTQGSGSGLNSKKMVLAGVDGGPSCHVSHQVTHDVGEESGDNSVIKVVFSNSLHRSNAHVEQHSPDGNMVCKDSLQKSIKDGLVRPRTQGSGSGLNSKKLVLAGVNGGSVCHVSHHLGEESGDSSVIKVGSSNSLHRESNTHVEQPSPDDEDTGMVSEISPQLSGGGGPCSSFKNHNDFLQQNVIRVHPSYLRTLSQAHSGWIFGAIVELVDNSRDAKATRLSISVESLYSKKAGEKIPVLSVVDDGHGMSHVDVMRMLSFGHEQPDGDDLEHIGRFGIGFKTGAMRLGKDAIVLTQTASSRSVALLSQSFNEGKNNIEIPIVSYCRRGSFMEVEKSIHSEELANVHLHTIKEFSPFNEYFIGEKLALFNETGTGTQIYIWNLDKWGSDYSLEWSDSNGVRGSSHQTKGDIVIRSRRIRSRPGQISQKVPLDYSLQAYLEVIFLEPRMKIYVQGSLVKTRPLGKSLNRTSTVRGDIMGINVELTLGRSQIEWEQMNCGMFLYWHGRLIEAYKRVGGMVHNADMGRGVIGVVDVTALMNDGNGHVWVHSNKQGFQDCEPYAKLEEWLGNKCDEYWDNNYDILKVKIGDARYKPDHEWVQCDKCRKWRTLSDCFDIESLPAEWFCFMPPFYGKCTTPEQQVRRGVITVAARRSRPDSIRKPLKCEGDAQMVNSFTNEAGDNCFSIPTMEVDMHRPVLKRLRRGLARNR